MTPKELKNIAPKLFEIKNLRNDFCVPKEYFGSVDTNITSSIFLDSLDRKTSFETPENYFSLIEASVMERIKIEENSVPDNYFDSIEDNVFKKLNSEPKVISLRQRIINKVLPVAIAASIALIFTIQYFTPQQGNDFTSINGDDIELWLNNGEISFNDSELAYLYEDTEIENVSVFDFYEEEEVYSYLNELDVESLLLTN